MAAGCCVISVAACSFSTDGITFSDKAFYAGAAGTSVGGGPLGDAGDLGEGGDVANAGKGQGGKAGAGHAGAGNAGKGGGNASAGAGGLVGSGGIVGNGGSVGTSGAGGTIAAAGLPGNAGAGGGPSGKTYPCTGMLPGAKLLTDFETVSSIDDIWKDENGTQFNLYAFPDPANSNPKVKVGGSMSVQGLSIMAPTGAGLRMSPCIDLRGMNGISFDLSGYFAGTVTPMMAVRLITNQNVVADDKAREGTCLPKPGQDPRLYCDPPHSDLPLKNGSIHVDLKFTDFVGGKPTDQPALDQVKGIEWVLTWMNGQPKYDATFDIDNVALF